MPTQKNVLIENGILRGYLQDKLSSRLMKTASSGSGRRESYQHIPMPRMTNTYMLAGDSDPADIVRSVRKDSTARRSAAGKLISPAATSFSPPPKAISSKMAKSPVPSVGHP